jgi:hypothetical protein
MIGDKSDFIFRLKSTLPSRWFADSSPMLDTLLACLSAAWVNLYALLGYVRNQTRIATATESWLDVIANDFFGTALARRSAESDTAFRARIIQELVRERATRVAVCNALLDLTGQQPTIFEPAMSCDSGALVAGGLGAQPAGGGIGYGVAGGWGSLKLPFQFFVTAFRPTSDGVALLPGWGASAAGYCQGSTSYAGSQAALAAMADDDIRNAVLTVLPVAVTAWIRIAD